MRDSRFVALLVLLALVLRLAVFLVYRPWAEDWEARFVCDDAVGYWIMAKNIIHHGAFSRMLAEPFLPDALRTPVYPIFVGTIGALFGFHIVPVFLVQILLNVLAVCLVYWAVRTHFSPPAARVVGLLAASDPYVIEFNCMLWTESLSVLVVAVCLLLLAQLLRPAMAGVSARWRLCLLGAAIGLSVLIHPRATYLLIVVLVLLFVARVAGVGLQGISLHWLALVVAGWLLVMSPWLVRNYVAFGSIGVSTASSLSLYFYSMPATMARVDGISFLEARVRYKAPEDHGGGVGPGAMSLADGDYYRRYSMGFLAQHPLDAVLAHGRGMLRMFRRVDGLIAGTCDKPFESRIEYFQILLREGPAELWRVLRSDPQPFNSTFFLLHLMFLVVVYAGIALALACCSRFSRVQVAFLIGMAGIALYFNVLTGPLGGVRHRLPIHPCLVILAGVGFAGFFKPGSDKKNA